MTPERIAEMRELAMLDEWTSEDLRETFDALEEKERGCEGCNTTVGRSGCPYHGKPNPRLNALPTTESQVESLQRLVAQQAETIRVLREALEKIARPALGGKAQQWIAQQALASSATDKPEEKK